MRLTISFLFFTASIYVSCNDIKRNKSHNDISIASIRKGKALATQYCQSCHMLPDPLWVDSKTWENGILPNMGPRLGIFNFNQKNYPSTEFDLTLDSNFYPSKPVLTDEAWQHIIDYYTSVSPDTMSSLQDRPYRIKKSLPQFVPLIPQFTYTPPVTSCVMIDSTNPKAPFIISDVYKEMIYRFDTSIRIFDSIEVHGSVVNIQISKDKWLACNIGILNPNNGKFGEARFAKILPDGKIKMDSSAIFHKLRRPVQVMAADLNNDSKQDYVICEFGYLEGSLCWMENLGNGQYEKHVLKQLPGAIKVYVQDYNHDGLPDIWALFAQGEEGVFLFTNLGNGKFSEQEVLRFPPIYGSSSFELDDFNKDGYPDILYTCGDNADYSPVLKPFHGVYIFLNDGKNDFEKKYFFPINGCFKAIARDFDNDGDLDIAAISYFPDYEKQPEEGFVYLENKGNYDFLPYSFAGAGLGRWLTMDVGDFDRDGKPDIILGNCSVGPTISKSAYNWKKGPPFIVLKNIMHNK